MHLLPPTLWLLIAHQISAQTTITTSPTAVRKMPPDAGEKFYHSYLAFPQADEPQSPILPPTLQQIRYRDSSPGNFSMLLDLQPAFAPISETEHAARWAVLRRLLSKRQWSCPGGTESCIGIGYPNSCCQMGEKCTIIKDTGLGPVGCCPAGSTCGGTISGCAQGNTPCGSEVGGGCCIPGFVCQGVGCVRSSTAVVSPPSSSTSTTSTTVPPVVITTPTTTPTPTLTSTTTTTTPTSTSFSAPIRPTSSTLPAGIPCPTGFYACLATAGGGCCQTGRDCATTSCPPPPASTTIISDGLTVAVPASAVPTTATGTCAAGWFLCGKEGGDKPGCCPSGYGCGTASCSLVTGSASATASVAKAVPGTGTGNGGAGRGVGGGWGVGVGLGMGFLVLAV